MTPIIAGLPAPILDLGEVGTRAAEFARGAQSPATQRAYSSDWADFCDWCARAALDPLPAEPATVGLYLAARAPDLKFATLARRVAAIAAAHRRAGSRLETGHPAIAAVLAGIRRQYGSRQIAKDAILVDDLKALLRLLPPGLQGIRDRAILLIGFAGAFRRAELSALDIEDINVGALGVVVTLRRSKTDQAGVGRRVGIPRGKKSSCPVHSLEEWLRAAAISDGALFRALDRGHAGARLSGQAIAEIVKRAAMRAGIDPRRIGGHSLRRGFATSAARGGADLAFIMQVTGHRSADVARRYVEEGRIFANPASKALRL